MAIKEKVLVVEDNSVLQDLFTNKIGGVVELLQAYSLNEAREFMVKHQDISLIILDGVLPNYTDELGTEKESVELVYYFRYRGFHGKILAYSQQEDINKRLIEAGCTSTIPDKMEGPAAALRELGMA